MKPSSAPTWSQIWNCHVPFNEQPESAPQTPSALYDPAGKEDPNPIPEIAVLKVTGAVDAQV